MAKRAKKPKNWPVIVVPTLETGSLIRWYAGRADVLKVIRDQGHDDVLFIEVNGLRIEVSFHDSVAAARRCCDGDFAAGILAATPARGRA